MKQVTLADVEEMRARGYDAVVISEAAFYQERMAEAQELCERVREAFADVQLGDGIGLFEGRALDDYYTPAEREKMRAKDERESWERIDAQVLSTYDSSLSFFDSLGMRFHLPAFIIANINDVVDPPLFSLTHVDDYRLSQFGLLNQAQRQVVRAYLEFLRADPEYQFDYEEIDGALDGYWKM